MTQRQYNPENFRYEFVQLGGKVIQDGIVELTIENKGLAINRAIRIRQFLKALRETPEQSLTREEYKVLKRELVGAFVSGPGKGTIPPFRVTVHLGSESIFPELEDFEPTNLTSATADRQRLETELAAAREVEKTDEELKAIFERRHEDPIPYETLTRHERHRLTEAMYSGATRKEEP